MSPEVVLASQVALGLVGELVGGLEVVPALHVFGFVGVRGRLDSLALTFFC